MLVKAVRLPPAQGEKQPPPPLKQRHLCVMHRAGGKRGRVNDIYLVPITSTFIFMSSVQSWGFPLQPASAAAPPHLQPLT